VRCGKTGNACLGKPFPRQVCFATFTQSGIVAVHPHGDGRKKDHQQRSDGRSGDEEAHLRRFAVKREFESDYREYESAETETRRSEAAELAPHVFRKHGYLPLPVVPETTSRSD
jgi:hypothetical protein